MAGFCASGAHGLDGRCAPVLETNHFRLRPEPKSGKMALYLNGTVPSSSLRAKRGNPENKPGHIVSHAG